ncbi:23S rRNA (adenine(2503)-C(2))-methyltransferase RlmN [Candidatus Falkowbacteria bacterium]|nr:23S rRNA (adenine(2503)-C(2))-methyltransferase RlmN [Candidatus Falkowbacteria bacterium]
MNNKKLKDFLAKNNQPGFRYKQIVKAVYQDAVASFSDISTLPRGLRDLLGKKIDILPFKVIEAVVSKEKKAIKALFELSDKNIIESVLISPKPGTWSACISSQVGCALSCKFCATGQMGIKRDLTSDEIVSQAIFWRQYSREYNIEGSYASIVYMGMGEPFKNWENVRESIKILTDKDLGNFPNRGLSISTSGVVPGVKKFANEFKQVNLAISLHFANNEKRSKYMPINKAYDLEALKNALQYYFSKNKRKVFIEYIMLNNINDSEGDAQELIDYLLSIENKKLLHVNLIRYNTVDNNFTPSSRERVKDFQTFLLDQGISCTIRKSIGDDIHGACGQLAGKSK